MLAQGLLSRISQLITNLKVLGADCRHVGDAKHKTNSIQDIRLSTAIKASD